MTRRPRSRPPPGAARAEAPIVAAVEVTASAVLLAHLCADAAACRYARLYVDPRWLPVHGGA